MAEKKTKERAKRAKREGKAPTTQAGEFVREEIEHVRKGEHGARSPKQVIAIGLSKARRAGIDLPPPEKGAVSERTRKRAEKDYEKGQRGEESPKSERRSRATKKALEREKTGSASRASLSRQAKQAAKKRTKKASKRKRKSTK